jgi:hypothetical protein
MMIAMSEEPFAAFSGLPELGAETAERLSTSVLPLLRGLPRPLRARVLELLTRLLEDEAGPGNGRDTAVFEPSAAPPTLLATRARDGVSPAVGGGNEAGREARFEDLGLLGQGGMGEVRRMRDRDLGRTLAMKLIDPVVHGVAGAAGEIRGGGPDPAPGCNIRGSCRSMNSAGWRAGACISRCRRSAGTASGSRSGSSTRRRGRRGTRRGCGD